MIAPGRGGRVKEGGAWRVASGRGSPASAPARPGATRGTLGPRRRLRWPRRQGGENGSPSVGIVALHARVTVRDSEIETADGGRGGDGGELQRGGRGVTAQPRAS
ncbi:hypothetical protein WMF20_12545 [Sorangium sp. So ce834]|uniref:hypothetical protein n=1 Tax=Sorangium sp. So ce834 TaxID=3133321 RepID=UPI003F621051